MKCNIGFFERLKLFWRVLIYKHFPGVFVQCPNCGSFRIKCELYEDGDKSLGIVVHDGGYICKQCGAKATFSEKWSLNAGNCAMCESCYKKDPDDAKLGCAFRAIIKMERQKRKDQLAAVKKANKESAEIVKDLKEIRELEKSCGIFCSKDMQVY